MTSPLQANRLFYKLSAVGYDYFICRHIYSLLKRKRDTGKIVYEFKDFRPLFTYNKAYLFNYNINYIYIA